MRINDKTIIITGGASGLGLATARYMVEEKGANVAIFDLNAGAGEAVVAELGEARALFVKVDVASEESVREGVAAVVAKFGAVHACVSAAALGAPFRILDRDGNAAPLAKFAATTAINLNGVFNMMAQCSAAMAKNDPEAGEERGVIINISSGAAYEGQIGQCAYAASKAGVIGLNIPAARELGAFGIRVNAIAPGLFLTPMVKSLDPAIVDKLIAGIEAPRRLGDPREFAQTCAFIIENAYVNGETIRLDAASRLRAK
jgi:NAD(P)-dependent dehydrogenase (short-subunit alcohol dehydrogenase family)